MGRVAIACVVTLLASCSNESPGIAAPDAGRWAPEPPRIPWLTDGAPPIAPPLLTPCPPGWREVHDGDVATCDPYPEAGSNACAEGFAHFPGGLGCEPIGSACPTGDWPDGLPARSVLYVQAGAPGGGDGTLAAPFARIGDAMSRASTGSVVALARGRWDEVVTLRPGVTLAGACSGETVLTSSVPAETQGVVNPSGAGAVLRNVRIENASRPGLWVVGTTDVRVEGVIVAAASFVGVFVGRGSHLTAAQLVVRDTRSRPSDRGFGRGLELQAGGSAEVAGALFERNRDVAVVAAGAGATLRLEDAVVRETQSRESDAARGRGIAVQGGASAQVSRTLVDRNRELGVHAIDPSTNLSLEDVVVRETRSRDSDRAYGRGVDVQLGARVEMTRALLDGNRDVAVYAHGAATVVRLEDVVVRDTQSHEGDLTFGRGLAVEVGAGAEVGRALFERNREVAISVSGAGTSARLDDVVVRDTLGQERDRGIGLGLAVLMGASANAARLLFERDRGVAVLADGAGSSSRLEDVVVRGTQGLENDGRYGRGLNVQGGASSQLARALFEQNREVAVLATGAGTSVQVEDVVVTDTQPAECGETCVAGAGGMGLGSYEGASSSMSRFVVTRAALCGVQVAREAELDLSDGEVRESAFGACVQVPDYRLSRLNASVIYVDNGANLEATDFPVPEVSDPVAGL